MIFALEKWSFEMILCIFQEHVVVNTTATATPDPSHVYDLHHSSWQGQIPNPLSEARDRTHNLMDTSQVH